MPAEVVQLGRQDAFSVPPRPAGACYYGTQAFLGPFPAADGSPGCTACFARRWQAVRDEALRAALESGGLTGAAGTPPWAVPIVTDVLAALHTAALHAVAGSGPAAAGAGYPFYAVDLETLRVSRYHLISDESCPVCGSSAAASTAAFIGPLPAARKAAPDVFRCRPPLDLRLPVDALVNPAAGLLGTDAAADTVSLSTAAVRGSFLDRADYVNRFHWGGHGSRYDVSRVIGLCEAMERMAGTRPRHQHTAVVAAYDDIAADALDPRDCGMYPHEYYRDFDRGVPFSPRDERPWVWGYSLRDRRPILVPETLAYYHLSRARDAPFVLQNSNGCASGGSLTEAIYHGLMEVVERDAFLISWYARARLPEIDPGSISRPESRLLIDRLALYGYRTRLFSARITFPIPVVVAVAERTDGGLGTLAFGAGASLDPESAVLGGLCEIATDAPYMRRWTGRELARLRTLATDFAQVTGINDHPLLYGLPEMSRFAAFLLGGDRRMSPLASHFADTIAPAADLAEDVRRCAATVGAAGFDVIVVDQTLPLQRDLGMATVKVIAPGLVPIDFGWRQQRARYLPRVRTALREAGLATADLPPSRINPAPHPFP